MEVGFDPFYIYQLRPFKKRECVKNFPIPSPSQLKFPSIHSDLTFGITPEEGIRTHFILTSLLEVANGLQKLPVEQYGLILTTDTQESLPSHIPVGNILVYLNRSFYHCYLEHGDYRLLKRAPYGSCANVNFDSSTVNQSFKDRLRLNEFEDSYFWSNGSESIAIPSKYVKYL